MEDATARVRLSRTYHPPLPGNDVAERAVNGLFADLRDWRLLKWLFGEPGSGEMVMDGLPRIDDETQVQIARDWADLIRVAISDS
jgi:hypothetical protein